MYFHGEIEIIHLQTFIYNKEKNILITKVEWDFFSTRKNT